MPYRFALFDADNTLLDFSRAEREALSDCLSRRGFRHDAAVTARYAAINDAQWKHLERGLTTREALQVDRFSILAEEFGFPMDPRSFQTDYIAALSAKAYLLDGAEELIRTVAGHCRLFLITNGTAAVQRARLDACPLTAYFEAVFISEDIGADKPDRAYFDRVFAAIDGFDPHKALVIGDSLTSDMRGGIAAGVDTCWFDPFGRPCPDDLPITYTVRTLSDVAPLLLN